MKKFKSVEGFVVRTLSIGRQNTTETFHPFDDFMSENYFHEN